MKILYIITGLTMGGAETITVNLAQRMLLRGHKIQILCLSGEQIVKVSEEIVVHNLNMKKTSFGVIKALRTAKKIVKEYKPDVVHANMFHAIVFSRALKLFAKIPLLICTEHSNNYHGKIRLLLEHFTDFLSDLNTNVSDSATEYFVQSGVFSEKKTIAMYNGIDISKFTKNKCNLNLRMQLHISDNDFVFINVSRFNDAKDHKTLITAFNSVHQIRRNTKLLLVGDGELRSEIRNLVDRLNISNSVIFAGIQQNTQDYYNISDCFVLSSVYEGFGIVLVEAMACELPVISTDCGGTKEIIANKKDLVPIRNSSALAEKMIEIMQLSREERELKGVENRKTVEKFDLEKITAKWEDLYKGKLA